MLALAAIPQVVASTVPAASKRVFDHKVRKQLYTFQVKITDAGSHANFTATIEGADNPNADDATKLWTNLARNVISSVQAGVTIDENGITFDAANGVAGVTLRLAGAYRFIRLGLAGDNAAADGAGVVQLGREQT